MNEDRLGCIMIKNYIIAMIDKKDVSSLLTSNDVGVMVGFSVGDIVGYIVGLTVNARDS